MATSEQMKVIWAIRKSDPDRYPMKKRPISYGMTRGYRYVNGDYDHPLYVKGQFLLEHRKVLYDKIGSGPHPCHWSEAYGCGRRSLEWKGLSGLVVDHLDDDKLNNTPENLVPACSSCNMRRGRELAAFYSLIQNGVVTREFMLEQINGPVNYLSMILKKMVLMRPARDGYRFISACISICRTGSR